MDMFAPELSQIWLPTGDHDDDRRDAARENDARRERQALEELEGRVSAARSIV